MMVISALVIQTSSEAVLCRIETSEVPDSVIYAAIAYVNTSAQGINGRTYWILLVPWQKAHSYSAGFIGHAQVL